jgi:UDP-glucuronate 4-epimerase
MKIVVTGSEGFVGIALVAALKARGAEVIGVDRKNGIEVDDFFDDARNLEGVDCVYHLAAQTSVFNRNIELIRRDNIDSFIKVCDACRDANIKLVYASSSTANACNTTSMYGISKRFDEEYARCYYPKATGVRLHNVYGANPRQGTLLWYLMNRDVVELVNNGRNVRHFTYISDIVEGLIFARGCNKVLINVANPEGLTIKEFAELVQAQNGVKIELIESKDAFDNLEQSVNQSIYCVPLHYTKAANGIKEIFSESVIS